VFMVAAVLCMRLCYVYCGHPMCMCGHPMCMCGHLMCMCGHLMCMCGHVKPLAPEFSFKF
jgi:hypothetical protein